MAAIGSRLAALYAQPVRVEPVPLAADTPISGTSPAGTTIGAVSLTASNAYTLADAATLSIAGISTVLAGKLEAGSSYVLSGGVQLSDVSGGIKTSGFDTGNGVALTGGGLTARKSGSTTFAITSAGDAIFSGTISGASISGATISGTGVACTSSINLNGSPPASPGGIGPAINWSPYSVVGATIGFPGGTTEQGLLIQNYTSVPGNLVNFVVRDSAGAGERYSISGHNHNGTYAYASHNHDASYSPLSHNHSFSTISVGIRYCSWIPQGSSTPQYGTLTILS